VHANLADDTDLDLTEVVAGGDMRARRRFVTRHEDGWGERHAAIAGPGRFG
jgi:hypothetical protein